MKKKILLISILLLGSCNHLTPSSNSNVENSSVENSNDDSQSFIESSTNSEVSSEVSSEDISRPSSEEISEDIELEDILLSTYELPLQAGQTHTLQVDFIPENATHKDLTYVSSDTNIVSVTNNGKITAINEGNAKVTVTTENNIVKSVDVIVSSVPLPQLPTKTFTSSTAPYYGNEYFYSDNLNPKNTSLGNGVELTEYTYAPVDGSISRSVYMVTVDLNLASIEIGTASNSYFPTSNALLKDQALAYENASKRKVLAAVNGDYFGAYTSYNSNGFCVKDGVVISAKSAFYESLVNGMMALSISYNDVATIAASAPDSSTFYRIDNYIELYNSKAAKLGDYMISAIDNKDVLDMYIGSRSKDYEVITTSGQTVTNKNVVYVTKTDEYGNNASTINFPFDGKINSISKNYSGTITLNSNQVALLVTESFLSRAKLNYRVRVGTTQSDNAAFSGVKTVITGRHNLINNYKILSTLSQETTNNATSKRARTAVGILGNGNVVLFVCEDGTKGLSLIQVADFMRYQGCKYAFNLDGGGSTGLLVSTNNTLSLKAGANSRKLANTVLVVEK